VINDFHSHATNIYIWKPIPCQRQRCFQKSLDELCIVVSTREVLNTIYASLPISWFSDLHTLATNLVAYTHVNSFFTYQTKQTEVLFKIFWCVLRWCDVKWHLKTESNVNLSHFYCNVQFCISYNISNWMLWPSWHIATFIMACLTKRLSTSVLRKQI
jgi:hypothetical protein